jgi:hypothetical protein
MVMSSSPNLWDAIFGPPPQAPTFAQSPQTTAPLPEAGVALQRARVPTGHKLHIAGTKRHMLKTMGATLPSLAHIPPSDAKTGFETVMAEIPKNFQLHYSNHGYSKRPLQKGDGPYDHLCKAHIGDILQQAGIYLPGKNAVEAAAWLQKHPEKFKQLAYDPREALPGDIIVARANQPVEWKAMAPVMINVPVMHAGRPVKDALGNTQYHKEVKLKPDGRPLMTLQTFHNEAHPDGDIGIVDKDLRTWPGNRNHPNPFVRPPEYTEITVFRNRDWEPHALAMKAGNTLLASAETKPAAEAGQREHLGHTKFRHRLHSFAASHATIPGIVPPG